MSENLRGKLKEGAFLPEKERLETLANVEAETPNAPNPIGHREQEIP